MGSNLLLWLGLIAVLFVIVIIIMIVNFVRTSKRSRANRGEIKSEFGGGASIDLHNPEVAERLGDPTASQKGTDPRGEDIGGNFSGTATQQKTGNNDSRKA